MLYIYIKLGHAKVQHPPLSLRISHLLECPQSMTLCRGKCMKMQWVPGATYDSLLAAMKQQPSSGKDCRIPSGQIPFLTKCEIYYSIQCGTALLAELPRVFMILNALEMKAMS